MISTRQSLADDYRKIGLKANDTVLIRASMRAIGKIDMKNRTDYINAIFDVIGDAGTLVALSFTKSFFTPLSPPKSFIYNQKTPAITGGFSNLILSHPDAVRSNHPTNSFVAIGAKANEIINGHDENTHTYFPMESLLKMNAKMLLIGCIDDSPGFTTVHLAEYHLGYLKNILFPSLHRVYFQKETEIKLYKRTELGSDSSTFYKYYNHYKNADILTEGKIGQADSMLVHCKDAYDIEYNILKDNPRFNICERPQCTLCRGRHLLNKRDWFKFYFLTLPKMIIKKLF